MLITYVLYAPKLNGIAPGYDKLRIEHLKALSGCNNPLPSADELLFIELLTTTLNIVKNGQLSPLILVAFRDTHIIALSKGTTGTRPIGLALLYRKMVSALSKRFIQEDLRLSFRNLQFGTSSRCSEIIIHYIRSIMSYLLMESMLLIELVVHRLFYISYVLASLLSIADDVTTSLRLVHSLDKA